jgi:threonine/homoserine/homoserine lactone efflux protein
MIYGANFAKETLQNPKIQKIIERASGFALVAFGIRVAIEIMIELLHVIPAFAITVLIIVAVPGQGVAMVLRQSILSGKEAAFYSVSGKFNWIDNLGNS